MERTQHYPRHFRPNYQDYQGLQAYFHMIPDSNLPEASIGLHHISKNVEREECNNKMMLDTYRVRWNILVQCRKLHFSWNQCTEQFIRDWVDLTKISWNNCSIGISLWSADFEVALFRADSHGKDIFLNIAILFVNCNQARRSHFTNWVRITWSFKINTTARLDFFCSL